MTTIKSTRKGGHAQKKATTTIRNTRENNDTIKIAKVKTMIKNIRKCENNDYK
jgi:hypothetical protein